MALMSKDNYNYEDLVVWQKSMSLVRNIYQLTKSFPKEEVYGLTSQIRRAAFSILLNIAEGQGRKSKKEFTQFLMIARGSAYELNTALLLARDLSYLKENQYLWLRQQINEITKMMSGLLNYLR